MNAPMVESRRVERPDVQRVIERELSEHIFVVSAQLVGICLTVLGLFRVMIRLRNLGGIGDNLLALDAIAFLAACVFSYASLRSSRRSRRRKLERVADVCFGIALVLMTAVCVMIAWELV
jgi:hypothetical protein